MKDDGIGLLVAEELEKRFLRSELEIIYGETDSEACFYSLNPHDFILILDAMSSGDQPGSVKIFSIEEIMEQVSNPTMQHDMSILDMIRLYRFPVRGYLIGIEAAIITPGCELSTVLKRQFPHICRKTEDIIREILSKEGKKR
ncbi:MAG: hydrogenase maturation protease [Paenibacillaceae bacterium]|nr:hydrogenase maturation protease [Paenibacillaceae bacterium]